MGAVIYHGPGSREVCYKIRGNVYIVDGTDSGLKIDDIRKAKESFGTQVFGGSTFIIGPLDWASDSIIDSLLKQVEDGRTNVVFWAIDISGVRDTLRSRCSEIWCDGEYEISDEVYDEVASVVSSIIMRDYANLFNKIKNVSKWKSQHMIGLYKCIRYWMEYDKYSPRAKNLWLMIRKDTTEEKINTTNLIYNMLRSV